METRHFKNIIIGFGKAGRALAKSLSKNGEEALCTLEGVVDELCRLKQTN